MGQFRLKVPNRRNITAVVSKWQDHKPDLKLDFNERCAYCDSWDGFRHTWFEVDHFVPKHLFRQASNITDNQYSNLVYACKFCNNFKHKKWPTNSETEHNDGLRGFVDPASDEYDKHFHRNKDGAIIWSTPLGKWMHMKAFKFDERERGIRLLWNLQRIKILIDSLLPILDVISEKDEEYDKYYTKVSAFALEYYRYDVALKRYYDSLAAK